MFATTVEAFNIAEQYPTPVIVLADGELGQRKETAEPIDATNLQLVERRRPTGKELENYTRFKFTESGISPISHPGMKGGNYLASGIEHNEKGAPTASGEMHAKMNEKRLRKFQPLKGRRDLFQTYGTSDAPVGVISWGSVAGVAIEAVQIAVKEGIKVKLLVPRLLYPVSEEVYQDFFASVKRGVVVEQNHQAQLYRMLRMFVDVPRGIETLAKSGSNPITPLELVARIRQISLALQQERHHEPSAS